ncbi:MAG: hypothetical protein WBM98_13090, partial [Maribacter sp.]
SANGQIKIGDNPQTIDPTSVLELESGSRVLVITRVTTVEMNAITPLAGAVVYNTDLQCVHYYDGTQWVNICEEVGGIPNLTTDPFVNANSTLVITPNGENNHIEVAPNSIRSAQIVDGGINGVDIQDNSIGQSKLGNDAVGRNEIIDNAVGLDALDTGEVTLGSLTNTPGFITGADIVSGDTGNNIMIGLDGGAFYDDSTLQGNILSNTLNIGTNANNIQINSDAIAADGDTDDQNELITGIQVQGDDLVFNEGPNQQTVSLASFNNSGSDSQNLTLAGNNLSIDNGNTVNLAVFLDNTDEQQLSINPAGTRISLTDGGFVDLPPGTVDTDEQQLTLASNILSLEDGGAPISLVPYLDNTDEQQLSIAGNRISLTDGGFVDLPPGTVDTDDQNLSLAGNTLNITDGTSVDLTPILGEADTDDQNLSLTGNTLNITDGTGVDLTPILGSNQNAAQVPFNPYITLSATNTQLAIEQLKDELDIATIAGGGENPTNELQDIQLTGTIVSLTIPATAGNSIDLDPTFVTEAELTAFSINDADFDPNNEIQAIASADGSVIITPVGVNDFDLSVPVGTDDQNILGSILAGETLTIGIEGGNPQDVDLATFAL